MIDYLLESSRRDDSNKLSNIGFGQGMGILEIKTYTLSGALGLNKSKRYDTHMIDGRLFIF